MSTKATQQQKQISIWNVKLADQPISDVTTCRFGRPNNSNNLKYKFNFLKLTLKIKLKIKIFTCPLLSPK